MHILRFYFVGQKVYMWIKPKHNCHHRLISAANHNSNIERNYYSDIPILSGKSALFNFVITLKWIRGFAENSSSSSTHLLICCNEYVPAHFVHLSGCLPDFNAKFSDLIGWLSSPHSHLLPLQTLWAADALTNLGFVVWKRFFVFAIFYLKIGIVVTLNNHCKYTKWWKDQLLQFCKISSLFTNDVRVAQTLLFRTLTC